MGQHELNRARCKRVVVAVGNCTRAMCVRSRRCQCASTESARSPLQRLYIPVWLSIDRRVDQRRPINMLGYIAVELNSQWILKWLVVIEFNARLSRVILC